MASDQQQANGLQIFTRGPIAWDEFYTREEIRDIRSIRPGHHVAYYTRVFLTHHAIVVDVNYSNKMVTVIHYQGTNMEYGGSSASSSGLNKGDKGKIRCDTIPFDEHTWYLIIYKTRPGVRLYPDDEVIRRAKGALGKTGYNVVYSNCEHFANWCKIGKCVSAQARPVIEGIGFGVGAVGGVIGITVGMVGGPVGAMIGSSVGGVIGNFVGLILGSGNENGTPFESE